MRIGNSPRPGLRDRLTRADGAEVPWVAEALVAIGFSAQNARRLAPRLPMIEAWVLIEVVGGRGRVGWLPEANPAAVLIWLNYGLDAYQAKELAGMGRGVLDMIAILDAVESSYPGAIWEPASFDVACEWASERTVHRGRLAEYIAAGISSEEAAVFEMAPNTRPASEQLSFLAALRIPTRTIR